MCRVSRLFGTDVWILGANTHEGWPTGTGTGYSTLSDCLLLWIAWLVRWIGYGMERLDDRVGVILQSGAMDYGAGLAGVCVGIMVAGALWWRVRTLGWGRWRMMVWGVLALMPPMIFATRFGALDESVLALAFLGWILVLEDSVVCHGMRGSALSGVLAGMAIWVAPRFSLPVILMVLIGRCIKSSSITNASRAVLRWMIPLSGVMTLACWMDGRAWLGSLVASGAGRWHASQSLWRPVEDSLAPFLWFGGAMVVPVLALFRRGEEVERQRWETLLACSALLAVGASWWMPVWAPLAVILIALCVEPARHGAIRLSGLGLGLRGNRGVPLGVVLALIGGGSFWPIARWWEGWIFPTESRVAEAMEYREEMGQLRRIALGIRGGETQPFLAPWYLSPAVSYWSMQPSVARFTSLDQDKEDFAMEFFASTDVRSQRDAAISLGVRWIICDAPDRFERNALRMGFTRSAGSEVAFRRLRKGRQTTEPLGYTRVFTTGTFVVLEPSTGGDEPRR